MVESSSSVLPGILLDRSRRYRRYLVGLAAQRVAEQGSGARPAEARTADSLGLANLVLTVDRELDGLAKTDPTLANLVELAFFFGCSLDEAARQTGRDRNEMKGDWSFAQAWLRRCASHVVRGDAPRGA